MYSVNPSLLLRAAGGCHSKMAALRWCLDQLFLLKTYKTSKNLLLKKWPFDKGVFDDDFFKSCPEFISIYYENDIAIVFSRLIKRHTEQENIMKQLDGLKELDVKSISNKLKNTPDELTRDNAGIALHAYCGLLPTKNYTLNKEVLVISEQYFRSLEEKHPKVDIQAELANIHRFFSENEFARRYPSSLKTYIDSWLSGNLIALRKINQTKKRKISADEFYSELMNE